MSIFERASVTVMDRISAGQGSGYQAATYTPLGGAPVTCRVVVNESLDDEPLGDLVPIIHQAPDCYFLKAEVSSPEAEGLLKVNSKEWKIVKQLDDDGHVVQCQIRPA